MASRTDSGYSRKRNAYKKWRQSVRIHDRSFWSTCRCAAFRSKRSISDTPPFVARDVPLGIMTQSILPDSKLTLIENCKLAHPFLKGFCVAGVVSAAIDSDGGRFLLRIRGHHHDTAGDCWMSWMARKREYPHGMLSVRPTLLLMSPDLPAPSVG